MPVQINVPPEIFYYWEKIIVLRRDVFDKIINGPYHISTVESWGSETDGNNLIVLAFVFSTLV